MGTNAFYVYSLKSSGFQSVLVTSNAGMIHTASVIQNTYDQMKFSFCNNRLALAAGYLDTVEVFDFNNSTRVVSKPISLPLFTHVYGIEFSDDQHLLYVSNYDPNGTLVQKSRKL